MIMEMIWEHYRRRRKYKQSFWVRSLHRNRDVDGLFVTAFNYMYCNHVEQFKVNYHTTDKKTVSKTLSRKRSIIDNALGILASRRSVLLSPIYVNPVNTAEMINDQGYCCLT